jgi:hypothetical protein
MLKNLLILVLSSVLSFGVGVASTKHCPLVKKAIEADCCVKCDCSKGCCELPKK